MKSYIREAKALVKESDADIDLDFYINLAEEFFYQITEYHSKENFRKAVNQEV